MLEDDGVRDRIRQALEFLDPSTTPPLPRLSTLMDDELTCPQAIPMPEATDQTLS